MRVAAAAGAVLFVAAVLFFTLLNARPIAQEDLFARCAASQPAWNGYQEDIKEIGARPVAQWHGAPLSLEVSAGEVRLIMSLDPPWDAWEAALPLLIRDPEGHVHRDRATTREGAQRVYHFPPIVENSDPLPPWIEIQYPHTKRRLFLDAAGAWHANETP